MKKVLSFVLVIAMVLSSFSLAFAAPKFEDVEGDYAKAIDTLAALGVITGYEDGTYRPENTVTRAEMAKLMVELLGYGDLVAGSASNFADTQGHWADAWIALAAGRGIVIGTGDGKFEPNRTVSYDEVLTMLVRGLGYTDGSNELKNMTWPTNFKVKAAELGITKNVKMATAGADRGGVAQAMANALECTLVSVTVDGDVTLLYDNVGDDKEARILLTRLASPDYDFNVTPEVVDPDNKNYAGNIVDLEQYMFENLKVYLNDDDEVVYVKGSNSLVVEGEYDDVDDLVLTIEESNGKTKNVDFTGSELLVDTNDVRAAYIYRNGSINESKVDLGDFDDFETIKVVVNDGKAIGGNGNGKIDSNEIIGVVVTERTKLVRIEKVYVDGKDSINGIDLPVDSKDEVVLDKITVKGDAESLEDIKIDDIVVAYASEDETAITLVVTRNSVEGKVTKVTDADTVSVNGTSYDLASKNLVGDGVLDLGDEGVFYLDQFGDIADYDGEGVGPSDYAVVLAAADGDVAKRFGLSVDTYPEVKLATQDGEEIVYELDIKLKSTGVVDSSVEITPITGAAYDLFTGTYNDTDKKELDVDRAFDDDNNYLIKYSLNSAGRIDEIEIVANVTAYAGETGTNNVDKDKDEIAEDVIVFDAGDDFAVVDVDALNTKFKAYAVENRSGDIEVLVVNKGEVESATTVIFAYLNKVTQTYNDADKRVNAYTVYVDGEKKEIEADDYKKLSVATYNYVISFDYAGDVIDDSDVTTNLTGVVATATAITANRGRIQLDLGGTVGFDADSNGTVHATDEQFSDGWYTLSEHGTVVIVKEDKVRYSVDKIADLYDIDKGDTLEVFFNADGEIDLIVIGR